MKKLLLIIAILTAGCLPKAQAQSDEVIQLLLNVEKLSQFKHILSDMKAGYDVLEKGYGAIKNISQGNFNMHQLFLDGLWAVSPTVRQYGRITDIINDQVALVREYRNALNRFRSANLFQPDELNYISGVYSRLISSSLDNLDDLATIITANKLRMSDDERIAGIDRIYKDMDDKLSFLRHFNNQASILQLQRQRERQQNDVIKQNYGIQ